MVVQKVFSGALHLSQCRVLTKGGALEPAYLGLNPGTTT